MLFFHPAIVIDRAGYVKYLKYFLYGVLIPRLSNPSVLNNLWQSLRLGYREARLGGEHRSALEPTAFYEFSQHLSQRFRLPLRQLRERIDPGVNVQPGAHAFDPGDRFPRF